jgi:hypothetical protein
MLMVKFLNAGGVLDSQEVDTEKEAAQTAILMIQDAGSLAPGDRIEITNKED